MQPSFPQDCSVPGRKAVWGCGSRHGSRNWRRWRLRIFTGSPLWSVRHRRWCRTHAPMRWMRQRVPHILPRAPGHPSMRELVLHELLARLGRVTLGRPKGGGKRSQGNARGAKAALKDMRTRVEDQHNGDWCGIRSNLSAYASSRSSKNTCSTSSKSS